MYCIYSVRISCKLVYFVFPSAGWTPLMYAAYVGHDTIVNLLLDSDADPSLGTPANLTPLMVAAGCGNESVCYFLVQVCVCGCECVYVCVCVCVMLL